MFFIQALNAQVMSRLLAAHTCIPQAEKKTGGKISLYLGNSTIWTLFSVSMPVSSFHWLEELQCLRRKGKNKAWSVRQRAGGFGGTSLSMEPWQPHPSWAAEFSSSWHNQPYRGFPTKHFLKKAIGLYLKKYAGFPGFSWVVQEKTVDGNFKTEKYSIEMKEEDI